MFKLNMAGPHRSALINCIETATARFKIQFPLAYYWFCAFDYLGLANQAEQWILTQFFEKSILPCETVKIFFDAELKKFW